jgi:hypothetical protein
VIRAVLMAVALAATPAEPEWLGYNTGLAEAAKTNKPMAVFIGNWQDSVLDDDLKDLLAKRYVTVYVDPKAPQNAGLLRAWEVNQGLVIGTVTHQVLNVSGTMTRKELADALAKYGAPDFKFEKTDEVVHEPRPKKVRVVSANRFPEYQVFPAGGWFQSGFTYPSGGG